MARPLKTKYPNLVAEMKNNKETRPIIAKMLGITTVSIYRKLVGANDWTISEIEKLCEHYNKDYYELFK